MRLSNILQTPAQRRETKIWRAIEKQCLEKLHAEERRKSVHEAEEFIRVFVREHWDAYWPSVTIECNLTMPELRDVGHLPEEEGTIVCRRIVSVPVINEELGRALWERLARDVQPADAQEQLEAQLAYSTADAKAVTKEKMSSRLFRRPSERQPLLPLLKKKISGPKQVPEPEKKRRACPYLDQCRRKHQLDALTYEASTKVHNRWFIGHFSRNGRPSIITLPTNRNSAVESFWTTEKG